MESDRSGPCTGKSSDVRRRRSAAKRVAPDAAYQSPPRRVQRGQVGESGSRGVGKSVAEDATFPPSREGGIRPRWRAQTEQVNGFLAAARNDGPCRVSLPTPRLPDSGLMRERRREERAALRG